jgi:hypothetical protein
VRQGSGSVSASRGGLERVVGACGRRRNAESRGAWRRGTSQSGRGAVAHDRQRKNVKGLVIAYPSAEKRVEKRQSCEGKTGCSGQETGPQLDGDGRASGEGGEGGEDGGRGAWERKVQSADRESRAQEQGAGVRGDASSEGARRGDEGTTRRVTSGEARRFSKRLSEARIVKFACNVRAVGAGERAGDAEGCNGPASDHGRRRSAQRPTAYGLRAYGLLLRSWALGAKG